jgi:zinc protease
MQCLPHAVEDGKITITLAAPQPADREPDGPAKRRRELVRRVGLAMLSSRLNREATRTQAGIMLFYADKHFVLPHTGWLELGAEVKVAHVNEGLSHIVREWRRARDHGFTDMELGEAIGNLRGEIRRNFSTRLSRGAASAAHLLMESELNGRVFESPEVELNRSRSDLASTTKAECEELIRANWNQPALRVLLSGAVFAEWEDGATQIVSSVLAESPKPAPVTAEVRPLEIAPFGGAGRIVRREVDRERGWLEAEFANHVVVRLRPVPSLGGMVDVKVLAGYGALSAPPECPGLLAAADLLLFWHPLAGWRELELHAALAGIEASVKFRPENTSFAWSGETDRSTLGRQLELLCACIARPGLEAARSWRPGKRDKSWSEGRLAGWDSLTRTFARVVAGDDPRLNNQFAGFQATTGRMVIEWMEPVFSRARLCVLIAGDFFSSGGAGDALQNIRRLAGEREMECANSLSWSDPAASRDLEERPPSGTRAGTVLSMPVTASKTADEDLHLALLEQIATLRIRKVLRESQGASYSPRAFAGRMPDRNMDSIGAGVECAEGQSDETGEALREVFSALQRDGWTEDEFRRAARPLAWSLRTSARRPDWWIEQLAEPVVCPAADRIEPGTLLKMAPAVRELTKRALDPAAAVEIRIEPALAVPKE